MKAGFAKSDITPRVGVELAGFGPFLNRHSTAVRDYLEARAAAFRVNGKTFVLITCDLIGLGADRVRLIRSIIREKHPELAESAIMVCCSHTHSGPSTLDLNGWGEMDFPYMEILPWKIAQAGLDALERFEDVELSLAVVPCEGIGLNRVYDKDAPALDEVLKDGWRPAKPELTDTRATVLKFTRKDGTLAGFLANFGCHPVCCCQLTHHIHGDFPAIAIHELMREFPGSTGLFLQGALGDVNSCCVHKPENESLLALEVVAGRFARAVREGLRRAEKADVKDMRILSRMIRISTLPVFTREKLDSIIAEQEKILHVPTASDGSRNVGMATVKLRGARQMKKMLERHQDFIEAEVHGLALGPFRILGAPFEIMQAIKNDVVAASRAPFPVVAGLCDGEFGYAPDRTVASLENRYENVTVPLMNGILPFAKIHDELSRALIQLDRDLG